MFRLLLAFCVVFCIACLECLSAQVVNVERLRLDGTNEGWSGSLSANADLRRNQRSVFSIGTNAHVQHQRDSNTLLLVIQSGFVKASGADLVNFAFGHLRYSKFITQAISLEAFTQLQQNRVNGIANRWLVGVGPRVRVVEDEASTLYVGFLVMREREREVVDSVAINRDVRASAYFAGSYTPETADWITVASTTYFQPRFGKFSDIRISSDWSLEVKLRENLLLTTTFNILYDARPPRGLQKTNYAFLNGLKLKFG